MRRATPAQLENVRLTLIEHPYMSLAKIAKQNHTDGKVVRGIWEDLVAIGKIPNRGAV